MIFLNPQDFETTDIFISAFFLCKGSELSDIRVRDRGRRTAVFRITGRNLRTLDTEYRSGRALVNPVQFRESLNRLRDMLFEKLNEKENEKEGRRYRDEKDRPRRNPRTYPGHSKSRCH